MHIGLIGGIGPAGTDYYYRQLIESFARKDVSLELTIVHADVKTLLGNLERNDTNAQIAIYLRLTDRLRVAGAGFVAVTSIAGHFCIDQFAETSPLPVVNMITEVKREIERSGLKRVGILGTRTVMESRFYGALPSVEVIPPIGHDLNAVDQAYIKMASTGKVSEEQRVVFLSACRRLVQDAGVEAIMLGGTDLALVFAGDATDFRLVDCAMIHISAIVNKATGDDYPTAE